MSKAAGDLRKGLETSVSTEDFEPYTETFKTLTPSKLHMFKELLTALGLSEKRFHIIYVVGPEPATIWSTKAHAWFIPIKTLDNSEPTVEVQLLVPSEITYIKLPKVSVGPTLVLLIVQE